MLRILMISPWLPWPPHGGAQIRILETLRHLTDRGHAVTLFTHSSERTEPAHVDAIESLCERVCWTSVPLSSSARLRKLTGALLTGEPLIQALHFDRRLARQVHAATEESAFDIVHVELALAARYAQAVSPRHGPKRVLSTHNVESERFRREVDISPWSPRGLALRADGLLHPQWERQALASFDAAIAVSEPDRAWLEARFEGRPVGLAPNGVDVVHFSRDTPYCPSSPRLVFTGLMDYPPNVDAACWFAAAVFPAIRERWPETVFQIVGARPAREVEALAALPGIEITGAVEDVRPYLERAAAFVVPLRAGGGTRLKILQAMAMGCPVVSTRIGAEGLGVMDGEHVLFADSPEDFVRQLACLRRDGAAHRVAANARRLVAEHYDWRHCLTGIEDVYRRVLGRDRL